MSLSIWNQDPIHEIKIRDDGRPKSQCMGILCAMACVMRHVALPVSDSTVCTPASQVGLPFWSRRHCRGCITQQPRLLLTPEAQVVPWRTSWQPPLQASMMAPPPLDVMFCTVGATWRLGGRMWIEFPPLCLDQFAYRWPLRPTTSLCASWIRNQLQLGAHQNGTTNVFVGAVSTLRHPELTPETLDPWFVCLLFFVLCAFRSLHLRMRLFVVFLCTILGWHARARSRRVLTCNAAFA